MFRNDYQRDESTEGDREVGEKGDEVNARESVPGLIEAGYMTQFKNDGVEKEMEKADHGDMKEEVYLQTWGGNFGRQWVWITASATTK